MTAAAAVRHYYEPPHITKHSDGNVKACCPRPEADHPKWVDGVKVRITLKRDVRVGSGGMLPKGRTVTATRRSFDGMFQLTRGRWGTNTLGQFAQLERPTFKDVTLPSYSVLLSVGYSMAIPVKWATEVAS